jgi:hypothetical protein
MAENGCKCSSGSTSETTTYGIGVTSTGVWNPAGYYNPSYTYSSGWNHAQKCQNCGYCSCCGKADIPGKATEQPEQPDFIAK